MCYLPWHTREKYTTCLIQGFLPRNSSFFFLSNAAVKSRTLNLHYHSNFHSNRMITSFKLETNCWRKPPLKQWEWWEQSIKRDYYENLKLYSKFQNCYEIFRHFLKNRRTEQGKEESSVRTASDPRSVWPQTNREVLDWSIRYTKRSI